MKKQLSVFGLYARAALTRLLSAVPGLLALDLLAYGWCAARGVYSDLEPALQLMFGIGLTGLQLLLVSCFGTNSRYSYTLRRLRISERGAFIWSFVCNALCYAALWCVQIMAAAGAVFWRAAADSYAKGPQGVFVTFYRNSFLHGLLPLADGYVWARNALLVLALGSITACMQLALRRKDGARWLALMGLTLILALYLPVRYSEGGSTGIFHAITALLAGLGFLWFGLMQTHNGKDGLADEVD